MAKTKNPTSIRLPVDTDERLERLAVVTGRKKTFYIEQAVEATLAKLEEIYLPAAILEHEQAGRRATAEEIGASLNLVGAQLSLA